jgi:hypothetical protein
VGPSVRWSKMYEDSLFVNIWLFEVGMISDQAMMVLFRAGGVKLK